MPDLMKLGVGPDEARYLGTHSYAPGSPMGDPQFAEEFYERTGFTRLLGWYLHHPAKTFRMVSDRLLWEAEIMRANNLGNYRVEAGQGAVREQLDVRVGQHGRAGAEGGRRERRHDDRRLHPALGEGR
jgi:hypothetical protein